MVSYNEYIRVSKLAIAGDLIGSSLESGNIHIVNISFKELISKIKGGRSIFTDESDLLTNLNLFLQTYKSPYIEKLDFNNNLLIEWCKYITRHHTSRRYGKTHKDLFVLVNWCSKMNKKLTIELIRECSKDRNSYGNGFIQTILPLFYHINKLFMAPTLTRAAIKSFTELTYCHTKVYKTLEKLLDIIIPWYYYDMNLVETTIKKQYEEYECFLKKSEFIKKFPNNVICEYTYVHALFALYHSCGDIKKLISNVASIGGDTDSVMACAMLLNGMVNDHSINNIDIEWINNRVCNRMKYYFIDL